MYHGVRLLAALLLFAALTGLFRLLLGNSAAPEWSWNTGLRLAMLLAAFVACLWLAQRTLTDPHA